MLTWLPGAGRVGNIRSGGKGLVFYDLFGEGAKIQIFANAQKFTEFAGMEKDEVGSPRTPGGDAWLVPAPARVLSGAGDRRVHEARQHDQAWRHRGVRGAAGQDQAGRALDLPDLAPAADAVPAHDAEDHLR